MNTQTEKSASDTSARTSGSIEYGDWFIHPNGKTYQCADVSWVPEGAIKTNAPPWAV